MSYTVKYNRSTNHIDGLTVRTTGGGKDMGDHVSYYAENACGSLTRYRFAQGKSYDSLAEALEDARKGGRKLCKTCEKAATAQLAAEAEEIKNEGAKMAATPEPKTSTTAKESRIYVSFVGKGKVTHAIVKGSDVTMCGKSSAGSVDASDKRPDPGIACKACATKAHFFTAPLLSEIDRDTIPGLGKNARPATKEKEAPVMAENTTTADPRDAQVEEIRASIERLPSLLEAENAEGAEELNGEIETAIAALGGKGVAALRKTLKAERDKAVAAGEEAKAAKAPSTEIVNLESKELDDNGRALIAKGIEKVKELAVSKFQGGHAIAEIILDIRLGLTTKNGYPDISADTDLGKKVGGAMIFDDLVAGLPEEGEDEAADAIRAEVGSIRKSTRNALQDVKVRYIRSLDNSPEEAKKFTYAIEAHPDKKPSEAIFAFHGIQSLTRAEQAKQARELKAAEKEKTRLAIEAGELSEEEAEALDSEGEKSEKEKRTETANKVKKTALKLISEAKSIEDEEEKDEALEALTVLFADLRKALTATK
ncbi:hypothetical protein ACFXOY_31150 [Streptomyces niveus]|uniref:hypothetical protein n=1 Tax=Streptomyces niveus TaxID=193462 RepID=UPI003699DCE4